MKIFLKRKMIVNELIILLPAAKYIKKIKNKSLKKEFQNAIDDILRDPYTGTLKTGDLAGVYCYNIYHDKVSYELAYSIVEKNNKVIVILLAGTRENFYEQLKHYLNA